MPDISICCPATTRIHTILSLSIEKIYRANKGCILTNKLHLNLIYCNKQLQFKYELFDISVLYTLLNEKRKLPKEKG